MMLDALRTLRTHSPHMHVEAHVDMSVQERVDMVTHEASHVAHDESGVSVEG